MLRITADTKIYISALQFGGQPLRLLELVRDKKILLTTSAAILQEVSEVLRNKFQRGEADINEALQHLSAMAETVMPSHRISAVTDDQTTMPFSNVPLLPRRISSSLVTVTCSVLANIVVSKS